jgi:hypothetical protein
MRSGHDLMAACARTPEYAGGVSAAAAIYEKTGTTALKPRYGMQCLVESLKMTPVSRYNTACSRTLQKEGL